jgi:formylglycine-generating enzyme required for sulfatase activity
MNCGKAVSDRICLLLCVTATTLFAATVLIGCGSTKTETIDKDSDVSVEMVFIDGGSFTMGCTPEQESECRNNERPPHDVFIGDFLIGKYEVTQRLWKHVMGNNPSHFKDDEFLPVENVSYFGVKEFIVKLNQLTGKKYRLPTEAEWEYAARGGNKSRGYKYSGSNNIDDVAWYGTNLEKTQTVGMKYANELGIYDMSGNVWEWVNDWADNYTNEVKTNPIGPPFDPSSTFLRVIRGGGWGNKAIRCRISERDPFTIDGSEYVGFRLALSPCGNKDNGKISIPTVMSHVTVGMETYKLSYSDNRMTVNDTDMVLVKGGTFTMGCTQEQGRECENNENPPHSVNVSDFLIGKYEVTQRRWKEVMGTTVLHQKDSVDKSVQLRGEGDSFPIYYVNMNDVQEFIRKLNSMTGKNYRLPTEAEWEFAARGGMESNGYKYSGGNNLTEVAWYYENSGNNLLSKKSLDLDEFYDEITNNNNRAHPVGYKQPNELYIYDMSGNIEEWVSDKYYMVTLKDTKSVYRHVVRGGSWLSTAEKSCVSCRNGLNPSIRGTATGFRLAMSP